MSDSDSDSDAPPEVASTSAQLAPKQKIGRTDKNQPAQQSTKRRVSTFRIAPGLSAAGGANDAGRDPRFAPHGAESFNEAGWRKSYDFLFDLQQQEADRIKRQLAVSDAASHRASQRGGGAKRKRTREKVLAPEQADALRLELERTQNRLAEDARRAKREQIKSTVRQEEVAAVKQGKKPFFPKQSELRERELKVQYEELRKEGKLEKFLAKRYWEPDPSSQHGRRPCRWLAAGSAHSARAHPAISHLAALTQTLRRADGLESRATLAGGARCRQSNARACQIWQETTSLERRSRPYARSARRAPASIMAYACARVLPRSAASENIVQALKRSLSIRITSAWYRAPWLPCSMVVTVPGTCTAARHRRHHAAPAGCSARG